MEFQPTLVAYLSFLTEITRERLRGFVFFGGAFFRFFDGFGFGAAAFLFFAFGFGAVFFLIGFGFDCFCFGCGSPAFSSGTFSSGGIGTISSGGIGTFPSGGIGTFPSGGIGTTNRFFFYRNYNGIVYLCGTARKKQVQSLVKGLSSPT